MRLQELVEALNDLYNEHGDLEVINEDEEEAVYPNYDEDEGVVVLVFVPRGG